jgi:predicted esterase
MRMMRSLFAFLAFVLSVSGLPAQKETLRPEKFTQDALQYRSFLYFWETTDTLNWQAPDRRPTLTFSSIAATGFGLSSYIVGAERGWVSREAVAQRVLNTLRVLRNLPQGPEQEGAAGYKGFYYHFLDLERARRYKDVELSTIDSGLLLAGILSCQSYFDRDTPAEKEIREIADFIYRRVEWDWMLNANKRLSMGWRPERGFITAEWYGYNEAMILYILALGSPTHPIPADAWKAWCDTYYWDTFEGQEHLQFGPQFGHQYSHVWIDFRGIQDEYMREKGIDYFENSRRATLANRAYCMRNPGKFKGYSDNIWGLTASDGPMDWLYLNDPDRNCAKAWNGGFEAYNARGVASDYLRDDGTIVPTAAGGSVPFAPEVCLPALQAMWETYYDSLVGPYGFKDAFNPSFTACGKLPEGWFDVDYLGIDQGPILLMLENHRSGLLWDIMKKNPYIVEGLKKAGFKGGWLDKTAGPTRLSMGQSRRFGHNAEVIKDPTAIFERHKFRALPYRFLRPQSMPKLTADKERFPLVIFLHGSGERGNDNEAQLKNGVLGFTEGDRLQRYPCYLLAPQCPAGQGWAPLDWRRMGMQFEEKPTEAGADLMALIDKIIRDNPDIDTARIYLCGLSMGGFGVFDILQRYPERFAAAIPLCSGGDPARVSKYKHLPVWVFHGQNDNVVPVDYSRKVVAAMEAAGGKPRYTEFTTLGHAIWQEVFYDDNVLSWLFAQKKQ